jgi:hypothetical protein
MCEVEDHTSNNCSSTKVVPVKNAVGTVLAHDITEIRPGEFKGRAFKKGHLVVEEDIDHLQRLGKDNLYILEIEPDDIHENDAAIAIANALSGSGVEHDGEPREGKINLTASLDGLLKINTEALLDLNMLGEVICATPHNNTVVKRGQLVGATRAIPLVVKKNIVDEAVRISENAGGILSVREMRKPKTGVVITGNEVYYGRIKDAFEPVVRKKIIDAGGEITGVSFAPDNARDIEDRIRELIYSGADLIVTTGGMSVDPDDVTRFAIRNLGVEELHYGTPVLPGSMFLVAYIKNTEHIINKMQDSGGPAPGSDFIPILGIPACGMYASITVFDLVLPRVLAGDTIGRKELAELGHGGLCLKCEECRYPVCPFGK